MLWDRYVATYSCVSTRIRVSWSVRRRREQSSAAIPANMIKIIVLLVAVFVAAATPKPPYVVRNITENMEAAFATLPGSENLNEKAMPLSKLVTPQQLLPGEGANLVEKTQTPSDLPGVRNLAEKRIPEHVLRKLFQPSEVEQLSL